MEKNSLEYLESLIPIGRIGTSYREDKVAYWNIVPKKYGKIPPGDWLEFGVYTGTSAKAFLKQMPDDSKLYLFDSFEGLPEEWTPDYPKGHFACKVPKFSDPRVEIVKGWFDATLPDWVENHPEKAAFIHIDCDIYSSTKTVLDNIDPVIGPNTLILLDDYCGTKNHLPHVYKAFQEYIQKHGYDYEYLYRTPKKSQVALVIHK